MPLVDGAVSPALQVWPGIPARPVSPPIPIPRHHQRMKVLRVGNSILNVKTLAVPQFECLRYTIKPLPLSWSPPPSKGELVNSQSLASHSPPRLLLCRIVWARLASSLWARRARFLLSRPRSLASAAAAAVGGTAGNWPRSARRSKSKRTQQQDNSA